MLGFFLTTAIVLAAAGALYWRWRKKIAEEVAEGAAFEWAHFQKTDPKFLNGVSEEKFRKIYARVHTPRFPGYALAALTTFFAGLPVALVLLSLGTWAGEKLGVIPEPLEIVRYVNLGEAKPSEAWQCNAECQLGVAEAFSGFYYFFGVLMFWLVIVAFYTRRFHGRRPGYLRDEIIRSRE